MADFVYHGSPVQNLKEIIPYSKLMYATKDKITAVLYTIRRGPWRFFRTLGHEIGWVPFVVERYKGMFDDCYGGLSGSVYVLDAKSFKTDGSVSVVSDKPQPVIQEIKIEDIKDFLLNAEKQGKLKIYRYPNRPNTIPQDDSDLIKEILKMSKEHQTKIIKELKVLFPDLYLKNKDKFENNN